MNPWSLANGVVWCAVVAACRSAGSQASVEEDRSQLLVGTWASPNDVRKYKLEGNGSFTVTLDPRSCAGASPFSTKMTASGKWKLQGAILAFTVDSASDAILSGSTMNETLMTLEPNALVLDSSIVVCGSGGGTEKVQLHKQ